MMRLFPSNGRTPRWSSATGRLALVLGLGVFLSCDDGLTRGPETEIFVDYAFGAYLEREGQNRVSELFVVSDDGRIQYVTVGLRCSNRRPAISPDGRQLVFESCDPITEGSQDLFRVDVNRLIPVNITQSLFLETNAAWSPRGDWIAFIRDRGADRSVEIITPDGSSTATLLTTAGSLESGGWSPDGTMIAVALEEDATPGSGAQLVTVSVPSAAIVQRTSGRADRAAPVWSPDGSSLAYVRDRELWHLSLDAQEEKRIPLSLDSVGGPLSWTLDGRSVILTGWSANRTDICRVGLGDSVVAVLTRTELAAKDAVVLPSGRQIAYLSFNGISYQLFTMDLQGFSSQRVTSFRVEEFGPVARPTSYPGRMQ